MNSNIKTKGFTLIELLAVIVILAIILAIAIPSISSVIDNSEKNSFVSSSKLLINAVKIKLLEDETFDITTINKDNLKTILNIEDENYSYVSFIYNNGKVNAHIVGAGKRANLISCGNYEELSNSNCVVKDGLLLYLDSGNRYSYPGSGTKWYDLSGSSNNGTLYNGVGYNGSYGGSLFFDGINDYVDIGTANIFRITGAITIGALIKRSNTTDRDIIVAKHQDLGSQYGYQFDLNDDGRNKIRFGFGSNGTFLYARTTAAFTDNDWHYLVATYDGVNAVRIYIDGVNQALENNSCFGSMNNTTAPLLIGSRVSYTGTQEHNFGGYINNVSIYNRVLSSNEVLQNFNSLRYRYGL